MRTVPTVAYKPRMFMGQVVLHGATHYIETDLGLVWICFKHGYTLVHTGYEDKWCQLSATNYYSLRNNIKKLPEQLIEENNMKQFTKADLRSGHKVKCRNGEIFTVFLNCSYQDKDALVGNSSWTKLDSMSNDLTAPFDSDFDIMEVSSNPVYYIDSEHIGSLVWKREEKSPPEQEAYEALQKKIADHEQTMKELKEQAEKVWQSIAILKPKG